MPSAKELAKALARQDSVTQQPRNRFLGATSDAFKFLSDQADRYVVPERDPLLAGMRGGDLLPFGNVARLLDDLSHGGRITTGRGQTTALRPEVVDTVALGAMLKNPLKLAGIAALKNAAKQIHTGTGVLGRNVIDPRQRMFAGEGAKTADHGALKVAKDMKAAGVPDEQIHAKTKWTFGFADGKPRFEIDDSAAKGQFTHLPPSTNRLAEQAISHPSLYREYPELSQLNQLGLKEAKESGSFSPTFTNDKYSGGSILAKAPNETGIKSVGLHELQHAIQQREGFARGGSPEQFARGPMFDKRARDLSSELSAELTGGGRADLMEIEFGLKSIKNEGRYGNSSKVTAIAKKYGFDNTDEALNFLKLEDVKRTPFGQYQRLAGEAEARLTQARMNMTAPERAASYPPSMFDVPVKDQIVRYGDNVGGAMMHRPKTEFEILHDTAQRNAALPVEQGGLGLPEGNTGMDRAAAMDWNTPAYHGSGEELRVINNEKLKRNAYGKGLHSASDPELANIFANHSSQGQNVSPLLLRVGNQASKEDYKNAMNQVWDQGGHDATKIRQLLIDKGFDTVTYNHGDFHYPQGAGLVKSLPNQDLSYATLNPSQVRSRFAAFDPMRRHEADILAGVGAGGMLDPQAIAEALRQQDRK